MSTSDIMLHGFAYGEDLEGLPPRSLGYRLLTPLEPTPWGEEVEALARRLQGAPFPEHWPPTDLFCSVLLADGQRLVALASYGLADHTPSHRRGGLELIGVVSPVDLDVPSALAIYRWLQARRQKAGEELHALGGQAALPEVLASVAPSPPPSDPVPVLPIRLWQEGTLLFAATAPADPDHRLGLLEEGAGRAWQWLPLVGEDFPLARYAQRGPLVAWTPHLAGVAVRLGSKQPETSTAATRRWSILPSGSTAALLFLLLFLTGVNLWATLNLRGRLTSSPVEAVPAPPFKEGTSTPQPTKTVLGGEDRRGPFAEALFRLLQENMDQRDWTQAQGVFLRRYEQTARLYPDLRLSESDEHGRLVVGAVSMLAERNPNQVAQIIRKALNNRGYDPVLVEAAAERVRQQLLAHGERDTEKKE